MGCVEHGKEHHSGWAGKRGSGEEACRGCRVHKSCHHSECQGGARSLFWQQTRASKPTNLIPRKLEFVQNFMPSSPPAVCLSSSVLGVEKEGDDPLDWLRSSIPGEPGTDYPIMAATQVSTHHNPFQTDIAFLLRTAGSPATVWCLVVTTRTLPQSANSTASASR